MDVSDDLKNALHEFVGRRQTVTVIPALVKSVDEAAFTCDVEDSEGIVIYDVRLRAALDGSDDGWLLMPEVGSSILIGNIGNSPNDFSIIATTAVTKAQVKIGQSAWTIDTDGLRAQRGQTIVEVANDGVLIERNTQSLKVLIDALIDQIKLVTVTCAAPGAPSTPPLNIAAFDAIKLQIDQILK